MLSGSKQSVPRAELQAIELIRRTHGSVSFASDLLLNMKVMRRLADTRRLRSTLANFDLWLEARAALDSRCLRGTWVRSHLSQDEYVAQFSADTLWAFVTKEAADEAAERISRWLDQQHVLGTWVSIRRSTDVKCGKVLENLTTRAMRILQVPARPRRQGPKPATRRELLEALPLIFPQPSWQLPVAGSFSWCVCCGLIVDPNFGRGLGE